MAMKLKMKQRYGSATQFDVMQAKQMGNTQIPLKSFFIFKNYDISEFFQRSHEKVGCGRITFSGCRWSNKNTASSYSTEISPSRGLCLGIFPDFCQPLLQKKLDAYISNADVVSTTLQVDGVVGPLSQYFTSTCIETGGQLCKHRSPLPHMWLCNDCHKWQ